MRVEDMSAIARKHVMVVGSGKPFLNSRKDGARLKRYVDDFRQLQQRFAVDADSDLSPA